MGIIGKWHSYGLTREEKNPMQKHNEWVDNVKDEWAAIRGIPLYRIWEHDIHKNPGKVMKLLKESIMHLEKQDYWKQRH